MAKADNKKSVASLALCEADAALIMLERLIALDPAKTVGELVSQARRAIAVAQHEITDAKRSIAQALERV